MQVHEELGGASVFEFASSPCKATFGHTTTCVTGSVLKVTLIDGVSFEGDPASINLETNPNLPF